MEPGTSVFGNPQLPAANIPRSDVPKFYRDFLNTPNELNRGHTLHEYWMEDSAGKFGVELTAFGPYKLPAKSWEYGISDGRSCPSKGKCGQDSHSAAVSAFKKDTGNEANKYELIFVLGAGHDESSTWQEFGEMKFNSADEIPDEFGPPPDSGSKPMKNAAATRYVPWTSWQAGATVWPHAIQGSSIQGESSGMAVYAHELSHLISIGDNYNNPFGNPMRRSFTGPWSMMSRGTFNGPGGPHTRWKIPTVQGGSMGSLHTMRDKLTLKLVEENRVIKTTRDGLAKSGLLTVQITARCIATKTMGIRVDIGKDNSPKCDTRSDPLCDGGGYNAYDIEVVDCMGSDSFQADSGVMISKVKYSGSAYPFQWVIDANPKDLGLVDFYRPNGKEAKITLGDYRQLLDALFHAGGKSGSQFEHIDKENGLHIYVVDRHRSPEGELSYTVSVRAIGNKGPHSQAVEVAQGEPVKLDKQTPTTTGVFCSFAITNKGNRKQGAADNANTKSEVYRLTAAVEGSGWKTELPNSLVAAEFGKSSTVFVSMGVASDGADGGTVTLTATSESDPSVKHSGKCMVAKKFNEAVR